MLRGRRIRLPFKDTDVSYYFSHFSEKTNSMQCPISYSLYVRKIHPSCIPPLRSKRLVELTRHIDIRHLEDTFLRTLSMRRGVAILVQGIGNSLCYISSEDQEQRVLEAIR